MRTTPKPKECPVCGATFTPRALGQKVCSRSCSGRLVAATGAGGAANGKARAKPKVAKVCPVCGGDFEVLPGAAGFRKTCSLACAAAAKRGPQPERRGKGNPNYKHGRRTGGRDQAAQARWRSATASKCQCPHHRPGAPSRLVLHHVVYRQQVVRDGGDLWDPRNAMTLCDSCHMAHHHRSRVLPLAAVPAAAVQFAVELMGEDRALDYLRRRYAAAPE